MSELLKVIGHPRLRCLPPFRQFVSAMDQRSNSAPNCSSIGDDLRIIVSSASLPLASTGQAFIASAGHGTKTSFPAPRKRRTEEHRLLIASFRLRKDFVRAFSKISPSASNVFCADGGIATFASSDKS